MIKDASKAAMLAAVLFTSTARGEDAPSEPSFVYEFSTHGAGGAGRNHGDEVLRVVRREHTGKAIGLQVLTSVLAGGVYGGGFKKTQLHGQKIKDIPNPGQELLLAEVRRQIEQWQAANPTSVPQEPVTVSLVGSDWVLLYQELDQDLTPYELRYRTGLTLRSSSRGFFKGGKAYGSTECGPEPVVQGYEAWADNDFAGVKEVQQRYVEQCAAKFAELLPTWLAAVPMQEVAGAEVVVVASAEAVTEEVSAVAPEAALQSAQETLETPQDAVQVSPPSELDAEAG